MSVFITTQSFADSFKSKRAEAIKNYKNGKEKLAFKKLEALVKKGDSESARDMALIFLKGKLDKDKAYVWFETAAKMCNSRALEYLKIKYFERGSFYFKPSRIEYLKSKCNNYKNKNIKISEKPKKKLFKKKNSKNKTSNIQKKPTFITKRVENTWKQIIPYKNELKRIGHGSAFAISKNGHFLTNEHVISKCIEVDVLYNKMLGKAKILKTNKSLDVAILKVNALTPFYLNFDDENYIIGETLYAAGYPFTINLVRKKNLAYPTLAFSSGELVNTELFQTNRLIVSIPIASGNSGGPVIGKYGLIRGQITSGFKMEDSLKKIKLDKYLSENITYSVMSSSIMLKKWINDTNILFLRKGRRIEKYDSDEIGEIATRTVAYIACYR